MALPQTGFIEIHIMTTSEGEAPTNRDSRTLRYTPSLASHYHCNISGLLPPSPEGNQGPAWLPNLPLETTEQESDSRFLDSPPFSHRALLLREESWESCRWLPGEGTAKGQNCLFASWDTRELPCVVLAAS